MKWIIAFFIMGISLTLFTGCETQDDQVQHTQDRKQDMLMKQMEKEQGQAEKTQRLNQ